MRRANCWEIMGCGRDPGGGRTEQEGVCPAAAESRLDTVNRGLNGGRACWGVPGTGCVERMGSVPRSGSQKFTRCLECPFFQQVEREEGRNFQVMRVILERLRGPP